MKNLLFISAFVLTPLALSCIASADSRSISRTMQLKELMNRISTQKLPGNCAVRWNKNTSLFQIQNEKGETKKVYVDNLNRNLSIHPYFSDQTQSHVVVTSDLSTGSFDRYPMAVRFDDQGKILVLEFEHIYEDHGRQTLFSAYCR